MLAFSRGLTESGFLVLSADKGMKGGRNDVLQADKFLK